jgi:transcriptional regulator with XRE-family HTH domain
MMLRGELMHDIQLKDNIVKFRKERGLTQKQLAAYIHYSDKVISKWECGESYPDLVALKKLSDFFEVTTDELIHCSIEKEPSISTKAHKLDVITTEKPSLLIRSWILIPLIAVINSIFYGPMIFGMTLFIFGLLLVLYTFTIVNYTFETVYQGVSIKIVNRIKKVELFINNELVDGAYSIFCLNPELTGKIADQTLRVKLSNIASIKCNVFID